MQKSLIGLVTACAVLLAGCLNQEQIDANNESVLSNLPEGCTFGYGGYYIPQVEGALHSSVQVFYTVCGDVTTTTTTGDTTAVNVLDNRKESK